MQRIIVLNSKGGCGKTTIATNLASFYAAHGYRTALFDYDPQASSTSWLARRAKSFPCIHGVEAFKNGYGMTRTFQLQVPQGTQRVIIDTPGSATPQDIQQYLRGCDVVLIPLMPSRIDMEATQKFATELGRLCKTLSKKPQIFVVVNRIREHRRGNEVLESFIAQLDFPLAGRIVDHLDYMCAQDDGIGIHEMSEQVELEHYQAWHQVVSVIDEQFTPLPGLQRDTDQESAGPGRGHNCR